MGDVMPDRTEFPSWVFELRILTDVIGIRTLGFSYGAILVLLFQGNRWNHLLQPFAAVGRTALRNYLMQSAFAPGRAALEPLS